MTRDGESRIAGMLATRTRALAGRMPVRDMVPGRRIRAAILHAGRDLYGIALPSLSRVVPFAQTQAVYGISGLQAPGLRGLIGLRGRVYNVVDLLALLHPDHGQGVQEDGHLLVLRRRMPRIALFCSRVEAVADILPAASATHDFPAAIAFHGHVAEGAGTLSGARVAVLDLDRLLQPISHTGELRS